MRQKDKLEKYIDKLIKEYKSCSVVEGEKSRYYTINGRTLRVSDHIGANSSGNMSIIIPNFKVSNLYIIHAHTSGAISAVDYEKAKEILRAFFYMSSIMLELVQESINIEVEKIDRFNADEKIKKMQEEILTLKKYEAIAKMKLKKGGISGDTILGLPKSYFEDKHIKVIEAIINKIKKDL
jgi:hydrogenase maturation factor